MLYTLSLYQHIFSPHNSCTLPQLKKSPCKISLLFLKITDSPNPHNFPLVHDLSSSYWVIYFFARQAAHLSCTCKILLPLSTIKFNVAFTKHLYFQGLTCFFCHMSTNSRPVAQTNETISVTFKLIIPEPRTNKNRKYK
jgi:hypothetical protein